MNPYQEKRRALGHNCPRIGGDSETKSETSTEVRDMRAVGGNNSTVSSGVTETQGNNNTIITTDHGAVLGGLNLATAANRNVTDAAQSIFDSAISGANKANQDAMSFADKANAKSLNAFGQAVDFATSANSKAMGFATNALSQASQSSAGALSQLAGAYEKGQAGDQVALKYAAFAVVGVVALLALKK